MKRPRYGKAEEIELVPDAWDRFRRGVHIVAKTKPKPAKTRKAKKRA